MPNRWLILFVLFFARTAMAFQFQSVAAVAPFMQESYAASLADIGLLIGLYLGPGVIIAIPGGAIAQRFGDRRVVSAGLILMLLGGVLIGFGPGWGALMVGRVLSGTGGIIVNVVMTKMLADWFAGHEIATAMGIFINSWPLGIAAALLILPEAAALGGLDLVWIAVLVVVGLGLVLFILVYRDATGRADRPVLSVSRDLPAAALGLAAIIWALLNAALAMVFSFGPTLLIQRDWSLGAAGTMISVFVLFVAISTAAGGFIADRTGRRDTVIAFSLLTFAGLMVAVLVVPQWAVPSVFVLMGLACGVGAGPIMTMPAQVLRPENRVFGMGVFFAVYYGAMMVLPTVAGWLADAANDVAVAFALGAAMLIICVPVLTQFRRVCVTTPARA